MGDDVARVVHEPDWATALTTVLADPAQPRLVFQPIVDLRHGTVVGYETLARFDVAPLRSPDQWFAAAWDLGLGPRLEADVLRRAVACMPDLPPNTFLTVNVDPNALSEAPIAAVLAAVGRVDRLVLELTEHVAIRDHARLRAALDAWIAAGAKLAVDDAGTGYSGLELLLALRPHIVKLDKALVSGLDRDSAKRALVRMLGEFAAHMDAWLLAEGVEETAELARLRVPLGQGWLLGRPEGTWTSAVPANAARIMADVGDALTASDRVAHLVEATRTVTAGADLPDADGWAEDEVIVALDGWRRPVSVHRADGRGCAPLTVHPATTLREAATRAVGRLGSARFEVLVCCDGQGTYLGVVRVERLLAALADSA